MSVRRFARLRAGDVRDLPGFVAVPDDGMCLSAYLLVRPVERDGEVLLGRLAPAADWAEIGGLDPSRVAHIGRRWMLPSSQLLLFESPTEAAERIGREQLGAPVPGLAGPRVYSEAYRRTAPAADPHWDLQFVFEGRWPAGRPVRAPAFSELKFVEVARLSAGEIARGQADVLALVGLGTAP